MTYSCLPVVFRKMNENRRKNARIKLQVASRTASLLNNVKAMYNLKMYFIKMFFL